MPLSPGGKLGPYEILAPLGAGGMGEVYRARDTKLDREVAIKVMPAALERDPERLARFEREAKVLASLNHPHIAQIYGVEDSGSVRALVMELVPGAPLKTPLALDVALNYARQIADALEAAHDKGIIHRDLKPANIMVTPEGVVKVLDFGLAAVPSRDREGAGENSPTLTMAATQAGMIMGTAAYMSPEQAAGKPVDRRADIWSYGVVLWEMLSGQRLFDGETVSHTLADVLRAPIDFENLPAETPRAIRELVKRCLDRDVKTRLRDIGEARVVIQKYLANPETDEGVGAAGDAPAHSPSRLGIRWLMVAGILAVTTALALWGPWRVTQLLDHPLVRLDVDLGADVSLPPPTSGASTITISQDGTRLAYASGTPARLFIRRLDQPKASELPGTQGASRPFFSPDGQWVGFLSNGNTRLNKISINGGVVIPIGEIVNHGGSSWSDDGSLLVSEAGGRRGLLRFPSGGGLPETVVGPGNGELALVLPQVLPGGKAVLFAASTALDVDKITIDAMTLADAKRRTLVRGGHSPHFLWTSGGPSHREGYLVYINKATLFAIPFDLENLETRGTAVPVLEDVSYQVTTGVGQFDVSWSGTLVYRKKMGDPSSRTTVRSIDPTGVGEALRVKPGIYGSLSFSPDGTRIAMAVIEGGSQDIWVYDTQRDAMTRLTFGGALYNYPRWSPDNQHIVFSTTGEGVFQARADGASQPQALTPAKSNQIPGSFTPDGKWLAYSEGVGKSQIWIVAMEEQKGQLKAATPQPFFKSNFSDESPSFSPDGRWLAYQSDESGKSEVYVRAFVSPSLGSGGKWQVSNTGGTAPRWSRTGHELVYQSQDQLMTVSYSMKGETFVAEKPRVWIAKLGGTEWDLAPDGRRVAVLTPVESNDAPKPEHEVVLLFNFADELRRKVLLPK